MQNSASTLIVPVENQVRELDGKLLLACMAAERGYPVILGSRAYCHFAAANIPRGVYLAKSMRGLSNTMFRILRMLGHEIVAWEEEALVHPPAETYFTLRLSPATIAQVSHMFAWGPENVELLEQYPHLPPGLPMHVTGNPRGDMLRRELRGYFDEDVQRLRKTFGEFILVNTNFSDVNPYIPAVGLFQPAGGDKKRFGQAGKGMSMEFASGLHRHKERVLQDFKEMIPALARAFPNQAIVIRPHPSERHDLYQDMARQCGNIKVRGDGAVAPWLLASAVMVHNGCTTGLEAYCLNVPAIAYLATVDEYYDYDFQGLPTKLSHQCFDFEQLRHLVERVLAGDLGAADGEERRQLIDHHLAARDGDLAGERILDVLDAAGYGTQPPRARPWPTFALGALLSNVKAALTKLNMRRPGANRQDYHDHRFPELPVAEVERRIDRLRGTLNRFQDIVVQPHSRHLFQIGRARPEA